MRAVVFLVNKALIKIVLFGCLLFSGYFQAFVSLKEKDHSKLSVAILAPFRAFKDLELPLIHFRI